MRGSSLWFEPRWRSGRNPSTPARLARPYPTLTHFATLIEHFLPPHLTARFLPPTTPTRRHAKSGPLRAPVAARPPANCAAATASAVTIAAMAAVSVLRPRRAAAGLLAAVVVSRLAGCGGSKGPELGADPAQLVPGSAPLYLGAIVRPNGALEKRAREAGRALTGAPHPYAGLLGVIRTPGSPALDFERDLAPWLGGQAGVFLSPPGARGRPNASGGDYERLLSLLRAGVLGGGGATFPFAGARAQGAIVLDSTDSDSAHAFVALQARRAGARPVTYRGTTYQLAGDGTALGVVGGSVVLGTDAGVRGVIDTAAGGASLARSQAYSRLKALAPHDALAHLFTSASAVSAARASAPASLSDLLGALAGSSPANVSLVPAESSLALDVDTLAATGANARHGLAAADAEGPSALGELPGDAFLAVGLGQARTRLAASAGAIKALTALGAPSGASASSTGISVSGLLGAMLAPLAILSQDTAQARRDFQSWMGAAGIFASGSGLLELRGAVVISSSDALASRAAVGKLSAVLTSQGGVVH